MQRELNAHHRLLVVAYRRYFDADSSLARAMQEMRGFFPPDRMPYRSTIGAPGSRIRRLYEQREHALLRLQSAHEKFRVARTRLDKRHARPVQVRFLTMRIG